MGQWSMIELPCFLKIFSPRGWWAVGLLLKSPSFQIDCVMVELSYEYGTVGQWSMIELPSVFENFLLRRLVGCWAAFEVPLFPDRLCDDRAELGVWYSGSVVND